MATEDESLKWLEGIQRRAKELRSEEEAVKKKIRDGLVERAVVFLDVVESTDFKQRHIDTPEVWILWVRQFTELLASAVKGANGSVIKYIGDEVMAVFDNVYDAQNLIARVDEIERNLADATGHKTRIKVTADFGPVYFLTFPGHDKPDPQGPVVDRCARIAKFCIAGEVLASADFARKSSKLKWKKAGSANLKGIGTQVVFQLERATVDLTPMLLIKQTDYQRLDEKVQELQVQVGQIRAKNEHLVAELKAAGKDPTGSDLADGGGEREVYSRAVDAQLRSLRKLIEDVPAPDRQYARFLFLSRRGEGDTYNRFEGRDFDALIEADLLKKDAYNDNYFILNLSHPRNQKAKEVMGLVEDALRAYLEKNGKDANDLFDWSLTSPEYWKKYVRFTVTR